MLVERFGEDIDYTPTGRGFTGMVWVLPVLAAAAAFPVWVWRSPVENGAHPEVDDRGPNGPPRRKWSSPWRWLPCWPVSGSPGGGRPLSQ
ncbi:MAG: hypothetical protein CM1200mP26_00550 [Acidimicrobiales bacterium]|nr:MAG: hypothetical protein CM1200mP26_00550 [Acidimicrobiales bacterium]